MTRSHAGRPAHVPTDETRNMVESLSGFGIPQDEIARLVGIDPKTLRFHYADQIELGSRKVKKQKRPTDQSVRRLRLAVRSVARYNFSDGP